MSIFALLSSWLQDLSAPLLRLTVLCALFIVPMVGFAAAYDGAKTGDQTGAGFVLYVSVLRAG